MGSREILTCNGDFYTASPGTERGLEELNFLTMVDGEV